MVFPLCFTKTKNARDKRFTNSSTDSLTQIMSTATKI